MLRRAQATWQELFRTTHDPPTAITVFKPSAQMPGWMPLVFNVTMKSAFPISM
jgi:hypothetical protein